MDDSFSAFPVLGDVTDVTVFSHESAAHPYASLSDIELFARVQQGEQEAFQELVRRHQASMFRAASSRLGRDDWAEEALQETWLAAFRSAHTFNPRFALRTWLWTILLNQCRRLARQLADHAPFVSDESVGQGAVEAAPAAVPTPLALAIANERRQLLDRYLRRLPQPESDALRLRFFGGMTFAEIAATTGCTLLTAKNRVRRGLMRLAEMQQVRRLDHHGIVAEDRNESCSRRVKLPAASSAPAGTISPEVSGEES